MNNQLLKQKSLKGFTIIETLIVLSIAGLIMLIVFEAIPALARSSRNEARKNDISVILEAVSQYELNNSGNMPPNCNNTVGHITSLPSCFSSSGFLSNYNYKLSYYNENNPDLNVQLIATASGTANTVITPLDEYTRNVNSVIIYNHALCDKNKEGSATPNSASFDDVVALYAVEINNSGVTGFSQCQQIE